jgi:hypothetical protein
MAAAESTLCVLSSQHLGAQRLWVHRKDATKLFYSRDEGAAEGWISILNLGSLGILNCILHCMLLTENHAILGGDFRAAEMDSFQRREECSIMVHQI